MTKKNLTMANRSKAFVMAAFIAVAGMHSVQAMQQQVTLNQKQQRAKQELDNAVIKTLTTSSSDQKAISKALNAMYNKLNTFGKAVTPLRYKDLMAKLTLDRLEKNITSKLNNILMSLKIKRENTDWATSAIAKHKEMLQKLENNTLADNFVKRFLNKLGEVQEETGADFFGYADKIPASPTVAPTQEEITKAQQNTNDETKAKLIGAELFKDLSKLSGFVVGLTKEMNSKKPDIANLQKEDKEILDKLIVNGQLDLGKFNDLLSVAKEDFLTKFKKIVTDNKFGNTEVNKKVINILSETLKKAFTKSFITEVKTLVDSTYNMLGFHDKNINGVTKIVGKKQMLQDCIESEDNLFTTINEYVN